MPAHQPPHRRPLTLHYKQLVTSAQALRYEVQIDPANASFYVVANGHRIARFNDHHKATSFVLAAQGLISSDD
jgi:hypothetical protein